MSDVKRPGETANEVRQKRPKGFYISDNELVDQLAAEIGIYAFGVYHLLMRKAEDRDGAKVSQRDIRELLGISTDSARAAIATLKNAGLVEEVASERPEDPPMYLINHAKDVLADRRAAGKLSPQAGTRVKTRRVKNGVRNSGHEGGEDGVRNSGQVGGENQDAGARNSGQPRPEIGTPNIEVNQTRLLVLDAPIAPASGGDVAGRPLEFPVIPPEAKLEAQLVMATVRVMRAYDLPESPRRRVGDLQDTIHDALALRCSKARCTPDAAAELAIRNHAEFQRLGRDGLLRHTWGWKRWFAEGHWCDSASWAVDMQECRRRSGASVGMRGS